ncbi:MAG: hypothetical protein Q4C33_03360 [bacterium]|nr:hypothetical protein [bacterium]
MNEVELYKNKKRVYISLLVSVLCIIAVSYAFFILYLRQSENNSLSSLSCFSSTLTEENSAISLTDEYPIEDEKGLSKTPFTFKITNNCSNYLKAYIAISPSNEGESGYILSKYMKGNVSTKDTLDGESLIIGNQGIKKLDNNENGYVLLEVDISANESKEFDLRLWIDYDVTASQASGMTYSGHVVVVAEPRTPNFAETILANNEVQEPLTIPGREVSAHTLSDVASETMSVSSSYQSYYVTYGTDWVANGTKFNLTGTGVTSGTYANSYSSLVGKYIVSNSMATAGSSTAGTMKTTTNLTSVYYVVSATSNSITYKQITSNKKTTEALLASTEDDYGTSYYFRGAVKNNYVEFANKCWRIVRINGDGSVKLVLHNDNTDNATKPCSSTNNNLNAAFAHFNGSTFSSQFNSSYNDNAYVGFMYGTAGSSDYASTHANMNKSTILTNLETWYKNNLEMYTDKLADTIWCNDKKTVSGEGYGANNTDYATYNRMTTTSGPSLICSNDNNGGNLSKFTVDDTVNGNGALTYKVGLLTADEVAFSGFASGYYNLSTYLQENTGSVWWWTMSPGTFANGYSLIYYLGTGYLGHSVYGNRGVRPAISLIPSIEVSGSGTSEDPYVMLED